MDTKTNVITEKLKDLKKKIKDNPKHFFVISFIVLISSFIISIVKDFYFPPPPMDSVIPSVYSESSEKIDKIKQKELQMQKIVKQMEILSQKRDRNELTKEDSLQVEYLISKYNDLKNGLQKN